MVLSAMFIANKFLIGLLLSTCAIADNATPNLGRAMTTSELVNQPSHVFADGRGLPQGSGDGLKGKAIYADRCASCHGDAGQGATAMELVGDRSLLASNYPDKGIAVYWPYAPTLFEYIKRAMPPDKPYSLDTDELYSLIAWLLEMNTLIEPGQRIDAAFLSALAMPNRAGFRPGPDIPGNESNAQ